MMVLDAAWAAPATKGNQDFAFCVSAEGADANCFGGLYNLVSTNYIAPAATSVAIFDDAKKYEGNGTDYASWKFPTDGRQPGLGLWSATWTIGEYSATEGQSKPFAVDAYWFQPKESIATKNAFRFSPGAVKLHAKVGAPDKAQWASTDFTLTGAVSIAAGVAVAAASLLAF